MTDLKILTCPECGVQFTKTARHQVFCTPAHKQAFYNLQTKRGTVIGPLLAVARAAGRYKGADRELGSYARTEADAIISRWVVDDRKAGRRPDLIVAAKREACWRGCDAV